MSHQRAVEETPRPSGAGTSMSAVAEVFKAAAHPVRAHILDLLSRGESSSAQLCEDTGVKASHLSRHLAQMRAQHLIQCHRSEGRLVYQLANCEVAHLLDAARSILHAQAPTAAQIDYTSPSSRTGPELPVRVTAHHTSGARPHPTFSEEQFAALENTLASRAVIADACAAIAARTGFTVDAAAKQLIITAHNNNITLRDAAARELQNQRHRPLA